MAETELILEFQKIDDKLNSAYISNNADRISNLLSDDWFILEPSVGIKNKSQFLNAIKEGNLSHTEMKKEVQHVKLHGNVAIVVSRGRNVGSYLGKPFNSEQWITNMYKKADARWICVMTQEVLKQ